MNDLFRNIHVVGGLVTRTGWGRWLARFRLPDCRGKYLSPQPQISDARQAACTEEPTMANRHFGAAVPLTAPSNQARNPPNNDKWEIQKQLKTRFGPPRRRMTGRLRSSRFTPCPLLSVTQNDTAGRFVIDADDDQGRLLRAEPATTSPVNLGYTETGVCCTGIQAPSRGLGGVGDE
jgi:hypothetical protein